MNENKKTVGFKTIPERQEVIDAINANLLKHFPNVPFAQVCGFFNDIIHTLESFDLIPKKEEKEKMGERKGVK